MLKQIKRFGSKTIRFIRGKDRQFPTDYTEEEIDTIKTVKPYTLTSRERVHSLIQSVRHITQHQIPGAIVECGVFRGGSMMTVAKTLCHLNVHDRELYLCDTFEDYCQPTKADISYKGELAADLLKAETRKIPTIDQVKRNFSIIPYPKDNIHYIKGRVEETLPQQAPEQIAILRLDTDWYESTKHELEHLYPRLAPGGVLIIDDYGHWRGVRQATDEYIEENNIPLFLHRIDYTGRIAIKP